MKPAFLPGDLVCIIRGVDRGKYTALVISVQQANRIPDIIERGLEDFQPWSFWLMTCGPATRFIGPYRGWELQEIYA